MKKKIYPRIKMKECDDFLKKCKIYVTSEDLSRWFEIPYKLCDDIVTGENVELTLINGRVRFGSIPRKCGTPLLMEIV